MKNKDKNVLAKAGVILSAIFLLLIALLVLTVEAKAQELHSVMMKYSSTQDLAVKTVNFINSVDTYQLDGRWTATSSSHGSTYCFDTYKEALSFTDSMPNHHIDGIYKTLACQPLKMTDAEIHTFIEPVEVNPMVVIDTTLGEAIIWYYEVRK